MRGELLDLLCHGIDLRAQGIRRDYCRGSVNIGRPLDGLGLVGLGSWSLVGLEGFSGDWDAREVSHLTGRTETGELSTVAILPEGSAVANPAFDVTPAALVTALITERGVCKASAEGLRALYSGRHPER